MKIKQKSTRETKKDTHTHQKQPMEETTKTAKSWFIKITSAVKKIIKE